MKKVLCSSAIFCVLGALSVSANNQKSKKVDVSCAQQSANDGCWIVLARAVKDNPSATHFSTGYRQPLGGFAVANSIMDTFADYKWFYNKSFQTVDFAIVSFDPPNNSGEEARKRYDNISPELLLTFLREQESSGKRDFDIFAVQHGSRVTRYKK